MHIAAYTYLYIYRSESHIKSRIAHGGADTNAIPLKLGCSLLHCFKCIYGYDVCVLRNFNKTQISMAYQKWCI